MFCIAHPLLLPVRECAVRIHPHLLRAGTRGGAMRMDFLCAHYGADRVCVGRLPTTLGHRPTVDLPPSDAVPREVAPKPVSRHD